jgi:3-phenylpropionate/trans-cinnamate dioxygenase ferredoxin component
VDDEPPKAALSGEQWRPACALSRLMEHSIICARVSGIDMIVMWNDGEVVACERVCPHEQADLSLGRVSSGRLFCPGHAASFDLRDGRISQGWPSRPLRIYPVRIAEGQVWINVWIDAGAVR